MIRIVPSDEVPWEDVDAVFDGSEPSKCRCRRHEVKAGRVAVPLRGAARHVG
ncbi:hypothetical protein [Lentzea sp. CC55]|uniref:hypothetical protein n=1 Tax=Lentzea sp. CC55 TaxID=2884909 RepID=UPI001F2D62A3|nr:hypothetical protein [Lentzea sp. CC55]MCG8928003.1 hypothetical protein [Lentzea sp. CC55]